MTTTLENPVSTARPAATTAAAGILDLTQQGHGSLRSPGGHPAPGDVQVPSSLIRRYGLRKGDAVEGLCERRGALSAVARVNGLAPQALRGRPHFRDLTPLHPRQRLRLETPSGVPRPASSIWSPRSARDSAG